MLRYAAHLVQIADDQPVSSCLDQSGAPEIAQHAIDRLARAPDHQRKFGLRDRARKSVAALDRYATQIEHAATQLEEAFDRR